MDSKITKNKGSTPPRRSTRAREKVAGKALSFEPTPRRPLKRTRKKTEDQSSAAVVNGATDVENGLEDEESPSKKSRLGTAGADGDRNYDSDTEMDVQESTEELEKNEDQEMETIKESSKDSKLPKTYKDSLGPTRLSPRVVLGERCEVIHSSNKDQDYLKPKKAVKANESINSVIHLKSTELKHDVMINSMADYKRTMEAKIKSTDKPRVNHFGQSVFPASEKTYATQRCVNNIPIKKETVHARKTGTEKTTTNNTRSVNSCRGFMWYLWRLVFLVLLCSAALLAYRIIPVFQRTAGSGGHPSREVKLEMFAEQLSLLKTQFPHQQSELWRRIKIHLEKHLKTEQPTEPVSLIFTAGLRAERTLHCLAQSLASTFSFVLNASVLHIDGASKAGEDSDKVKLDIDNQLQAAFEGDKPVAVIHRFEELPPGSTLIFYRYCDHENAAYKKVFLLFTLLLPQDEISSQLSLKEVEEMAQEHAIKKLVGSESQAAFNKMDFDKFGGLWSRISHLILPVASEVEIEQGGCPYNKPTSQKETVLDQADS
ncbi:torsin-1A-interacting protein 1-like isoform X1 [Melanotaenia boesemani]|uniref:torsin-1A-interacting protein 1-like isoform X1 n=1 Tax=Melanotaenia boesemani TaxID=1250792 RepID=UPI001C0530E1|nr:torsin-1A-interacting protein 1-like isoform X1 [Melanotaenia boesemani]